MKGKNRLGVGETAPNHQENIMKNLIYDRTFDAACMKRAGEDEWASQILTRLRANNPKYLEQIDRLYNTYLNLPNAEYIEYRKNYMLENKDTIILRFR